MHAWNCLIEKYAIAPCRLAISVSMACCSWESLPLVSIAGRYVLPEPRNSSTAASLALRQQLKKWGFVRACVAGPKPLRIWRRGVELRTQFLEHWLSLRMVRSMVTTQTLRGWQNALAWESANSGGCS